jgi:hypothetical protein
VVVTITAANVSEASWQVVETLPDGFTYDDENPATAEGSADPAVLVMKDGQRVTFTLLAEDTAFTYTVTAPDVTMTKTYEFRGKLKGDTPAEDRDVDGPYMVTVRTPDVAPSGPSATRSFDSESVDPRDPVVVTITAANVSEASWQVVETLPDGFTYDDENPATAEGSADPAVLVMKDGQRVTFTLLAEDTAFTYTVTAPDVTMTKTYEFRGKLKGDTPAEDRDVDGPYMVTVRTPDVAPSGPRMWLPRMWLPRMWLPRMWLLPGPVPRDRSIVS